MPCKMESSNMENISVMFDPYYMDGVDGACGDQGFYNTSHPGKDLFQKFDFDYLTPPGSPDHDGFESPLPAPGDLCICQTLSLKCQCRTSPITDKNLQNAVTNLLDAEATKTMLNLFPDQVKQTDIESNLIQDCMWSAPGLAAAGLLGDASAQHRLMKPLIPVSTGKSSMDINSTVCVDPTTVFPYPVSTESSTNTPGLATVTETPSPSESDDDGDLDDDDEDDEDEEEIDVVTVMPPRKRHCPGMSTFSQHVAAMHNYSSPQSPPTTVSLSAPQSPSNNCGLQMSLVNGHKGRPMSMPASPQPVTKRQRSLLKEADLNRVVQKLKMRNHHQYSKHHISRSSSSHSSRHSSDSEESDGTKRAQHNVLERKRRNDLKYSFLRLRDNVPDIQKQERTPKVTILKQSSKFVYQLRRKNNELEREYERQKALHEQLQKRLNSMRKHLL